MSNLEKMYNEKLEKLFRKKEKLFFKKLISDFSIYIKKDHSDIKIINDISEKIILEYFRNSYADISSKEIKFQINNLISITKYDLNNVRNFIVKYNLDKCPYCGGDILFKKDSSYIYSKNYGPIYVCENYPKCNSYVGTHPNTSIPLGRLANAELRQYKKAAHEYFDFMWQCKKRLGDKNARSKGYHWLAMQLDKDLLSTHIGWFNLYDCQKVIALCKPYYTDLKKKIKNIT